MVLIMKALLAALLLFVTDARPEKKIELQDIEEDFLKSEKDKENNKLKVQPVVNESEKESIPLDNLKNDIIRYLGKHSLPQQTRYVAQYAVDEATEMPTTSKVQSNPGIINYSSTMPMHFYLVPQYDDQIENSVGVPTAEDVHYNTAPVSVERPSVYLSQDANPLANYIEVPAYIIPSGKGFMQPYNQQLGYLTYSPEKVSESVSPHLAVVTTAAPVMTYHMPMVQYPLASPRVLPKGYYAAKLVETNNAQEELLENEVKSSQQNVLPTEAQFKKPSHPEHLRYYSSQVPFRQEQRQGPIVELPAPNPILLKGSPQPVPKTLPFFKPLFRSVYGGAKQPNYFTPRPVENYAYAKRRPTSLVDSYIPSSVQLEYMKRGHARDPLSAYEALSSARSLYAHAHVPPPSYERGFLPNQMYHTAAGGVTYGHYKRTPKLNTNTY